MSYKFSTRITIAAQGWIIVLCRAITFYLIVVAPHQAINKRRNPFFGVVERPFKRG